MKVLTVVGARPQFVKAAAVSPILRDNHTETLVHTGQHYDDVLSDVFFDELSIPDPDYNLGIGSAPHGDQTAAMIAALEPVITDESPDVVLTYGDTNSTLAAAITTSKLDPDLAHVEAGLRTDDLDIPEEINRVLTDRVADYLFAPTESAATQLETEATAGTIEHTGDVMYDTLLDIRPTLDDPDTVLTTHDIHIDDDYILATVHRQRNTDDPNRLHDIIDALTTVDAPVILPAHPRTTAALNDYDLYDTAATNLHLTDPLGYLDFIALIDGATRVATDSGGVQKEAFFLDTPCITLRDDTEWTETTACGWNELVGTDPDQIIDALTTDWTLTGNPTPFGDGTAAQSIVDTLETHAT